MPTAFMNEKHRPKQPGMCVGRVSTRYAAHHDQFVGLKPDLVLFFYVESGGFYGDVLVAS